MVWVLGQVAPVLTCALCVGIGCINVEIERVTVMMIMMKTPQSQFQTNMGQECRVGV
jgi:hypothetical protein